MAWPITYSSNRRRKNAASASAGNVTELVTRSVEIGFVINCQAGLTSVDDFSNTAGMPFAGQEITAFALDRDRFKLGGGATGGRKTMKFGPDRSRTAASVLQLPQLIRDLRQTRVDLT